MQTYLHRRWYCWCLVAKTLMSPHSALKLHACWLQATDSAVWLLSSLQNPKVGPWPTIISFSKVWCQLEFVQFFPLLPFFLKSTAYHHNFSSAWNENRWDCRDKKLHQKKQVECSSQKASHSVSYTKLQILSPDHEWHWAAAITAPLRTASVLNSGSRYKKW